MSETLVERLLSGKPTPLEREAAEAITQAQARCAEVEKEKAELREALAELVRIDDESGLLTDASSDLVLALDEAYNALKEPR